METILDWYSGPNLYFEQERRFGRSTNWQIAMLDHNGKLLGLGRLLKYSMTSYFNSTI